METEDKAPSLRESLMENFETLSGESVEEPTEESAPEEEVSADDGQQAAPEGEPAEATENASVEQEPEKVFEPPQHWSKEDRDTFSKLDDTGRELMLGVSKNWESGLSKKMEELAEQRKRYSGFDSFTETLQGQYPNATKEQITSALAKELPNWFSTYVSLQSDPAGTLRKLADAYNVSDKLSESLLSQDNDESARSKRLRESQLEQENIRLKSEQMQSARDKADREIGEFRDATGPDGKPLRPYFKELEPVMAKLISSDNSITLEKAYQMAMRTEKFDELQAQEREKVKAEIEAERRKKANSRKITKTTIGRSSGSATSQAKPKDLRDTLSENWDQLANR